MDFTRVLNKLDHMVETKDFEGARALLDYWISDAASHNDLQSELYLYNESMGLYRKLGDEERAVASAGQAMELIGRTGMEGTVTAGTTYINAATVYKAFGRAEDGIPLFDKARGIYEKNLREDDGRLGGLYNNMGLALTDMGRYEEALASYGRALEVMAKVEHGRLESAITYLNMADVYDHKRGEDKELYEQEITDLLTNAWECLEDKTLPRDGYYSFVAEKCAPSFGYYGWFMAKNQLESRCITPRS